MSASLHTLATAARLAPSLVRHSTAMLLFPALQVERLSRQKLARVLDVGEEALQDYHWEKVHHGTTSRWRLHLPQGGETLFAKSNPPDFGTRLFGAFFGLSVNELGFYRDLAPDITIPVPRARGLFGNRYRYLLLLEDLAAKASFSDISARCDLTRAQSVIDTLATLHARYWQDRRFTQQWQWVNRQEHKRNSNLLALLREHSATQVVQRYPEFLPDNISTIAKKINDCYGQLEQLWAKGPRTLVHGDAHIGNMYFLHDGTTGLLDWQVLGHEQGMRDVTYFLVNSVPTEVRTAHQQQLIQRYLDGLATQGISVSLDTALYQYQTHVPYVWVSAAITAASSTMQETAIATAGLSRAARALVDLDVEPVLSSL